jgi:hypothetical protein
LIRITVKSRKKYLLSKKKQFGNYIAINTACGSKRKQLGSRIMEHKDNHDKETFLDGENDHLD